MAINTLDFVLIIGISDYSAFDRSAGQPAGTSDVPGARNDARAWLQQCLAMGIPGENIRVLTAPLLSTADLDIGLDIGLDSRLDSGLDHALDGNTAAQARGVHFAEATHDHVVAGLRWLAEKLSGPGARAGLMTFSGHGTGHDQTSRALLLCPADVRDAGDGTLDGVVDVMALRRELGQGKPARAWTMALDCCNAQAGAGRTSAIRARLQAQRQGLDLPADASPAERILSACAWDEASVSARFCGQTMGAFTWAMTSAMGQWQTARAHGVLWLDASYGQLHRRTRALLSALSFAQTPILSGPAGVARMPFLCPDEHLGQAGTSFAPSAAKPRRQLDAGDSDYRYYTLVLHDPERALYCLLAYVFVSNDAGTVTLADKTSLSLPAATESWYLTPLDKLKPWLPGMQQLCIYASPSLRYASPGPSITMGSSMLLESAPVTGAFTPVDTSQGWPSGGYKFASSIHQSSIPVSVCITPTSDGTALERVDWYIPQSEYKDTNLFSAVPDGGNAAGYIYDVSQNVVLDSAWYQATSQLTTIKTS